MFRYKKLIKCCVFWFWICCLNVVGSWWINTRTIEDRRNSRCSKTRRRIGDDSPDDAELPGEILEIQTSIGSLPSCGDSSEHEGPDSSKMIQSLILFWQFNELNFFLQLLRPSRKRKIHWNINNRPSRCKRVRVIRVPTGRMEIALGYRNHRFYHFRELDGNYELILNFVNTSGLFEN